MPEPAFSGVARNLIFIVVGTEQYGVQRMTVSTIRALIEAGNDISVIGLSSGEMLDRCREAGAKILALDLPPPPNYRPSLLDNVRSAFALRAYSRKAIRPLAGAIKTCGSWPVIVRMPNIVPLVARAAHAAKAKSYWITPNIISSRYPLAANKIIYEFLFARFGMVPIANSHFTRGTFLNWLSSARVLHLGIDQAEFEPDSFEASSTRTFLGYSPEDVVIGVFARLVREKGQDRLMRAVAALGNQGGKLHLLIAGAGDPAYEFELKELAATLDLTDRIKFLGPVTDLRPLYNACDLIANSRVDPEPFGLSVIEAMMMAKPVLAHRLGGPGETVLDGVTGWLTPNASVEAFSDALSRAFADRARWKEMGAAGRLHAIENFESSRVAANLMAIVSEKRLGRS